MIIEEDDVVIFRDWRDLSYHDNGDTHVQLFVNDNFVGNVKVWVDSFDRRQYICLNNHIYYLHDMKVKQSRNVFHPEHGFCTMLGRNGNDLLLIIED